MEKSDFLNIHQACAALPNKTDPSPAHDRLLYFNSSAIVASMFSAIGADPQLFFCHLAALL